MRKTPTPGKATCEDVASLLDIPLTRTVKSLVIATEEAGVAEGEDPAVGRHEPVAVAGCGWGHSDDRTIELQAAGGLGDLFHDLCADRLDLGAGR